MTRVPWFRSDPDRLAAIERDVCQNFPTLALEDDAGVPVFRGRFPISFEEEQLDEFYVEVRLSSEDPDDVPLVREIGGRIPRTADYHINNADGDTCLFVPDERWRIFPRGATLVEFLHGPVRNHFIGAALKLRGDPWPFGERPHGKEGVLEYYSELLGTEEPKLIIMYIRILAVPIMKRHWSCPCGSGQIIRKCHDEQIEDLRKKVRCQDALRTLHYLEN